MAVSNSLPRLIITLGLIAGASAALLAGVAQFTAAPIAEQELNYELAAVRAVMKIDPANLPSGTVLEKAVVPGSEAPAYRLRSESTLLAAALKTHYLGYGGQVYCITGIDPAGVVMGIEVVQGKDETPGLGTKAFEPAFLQQFIGKSLSDATWDVTKDGGSFHTIAGATYTPRAVTKSAGEALELFSQNQDFFTAADGASWELLETY